MVRARQKKYPCINIAIKNTVSPAITIITITFNDLLGFTRTANSIIPQLSCDVEWIIKDGGSDESIMPSLLKLLDGIDCKFFSYRDSGVYNAMNRAINVATGEWLVFMNGGDEFASSNVVEKFLDAVRHRGLVSSCKQILVGGTFLISEQGSRIYKGSRTLVECMGINSYRMAAFHQSQFFSKAIYAHQAFRENLQVSADHAFFWDAIFNGALLENLDFPVSCFYLGGISSKKRFQSCMDVGFSIFRIQKMVNFIGLLAVIKRLVVSFVPR